MSRHQQFRGLPVRMRQQGERLLHPSKCKMLNIICHCGLVLLTGDTMRDFHNAMHHSCHISLVSRAPEMHIKINVLNGNFENHSQLKKKKSIGLTLCCGVKKNLTVKIFSSEQWLLIVPSALLPKDFHFWFNANQVSYLRSSLYTQSLNVKGSERDHPCWNRERFPEDGRPFQHSLRASRDSGSALGFRKRPSQQQR